MSRPPQRAAAHKVPTKRYLTANEAAQYLRDLGFTSVTVETIKHYAYRTGQLARPKVAGRHAYWARKDLDQLVENL